MKGKLFINNDQLREIRRNTDWKKLFEVLGLQKDEKKSTIEDWWALSPFTEEENSSFHINDKGFYCFSSNEKGGPIELVQAYFRYRLNKTVNCYEAGKWLLENKVSFLPDGSDAPEPKRSEGKEKSEIPEEEPIQQLENKPIRQSLVPLLTEQGTHPEFVRRGISKATCEYLGCGYLEKASGEMQGRIIFQVRGLKPKNGVLSPVILTHIGRATSDEQEETGGKWKPYKGFLKSLEIYNIDKLLLDEDSVNQVKETGRVLVVEGCFDVAKLIEADIKNVIATFGSHLCEEQLPRLELIKERLGDIEFFFWYDRDHAGREGQEKALELLSAKGFKCGGFDWDISFRDRKRGEVKIPDSLQDACDLSVEQLFWLRDKKII